MSRRLYTFRVDAPEDGLEQLLETIRKYGKYTLWHEFAKKSGKSHFQGVAELNCSIDTIYTQLRRKGYTGRGSKHIEPIEDLDKYMVYVTKDLNIVLNELFEQKQLDEWIATTVKINKEKEERRSVLYCVNQAYEEYAESGQFPELGSGEQAIVRKRAIAQFTIKQYVRLNRPYTAHDIKRVVNLVYTKFCIDLDIIAEHNPSYFNDYI